MGIRKGVRECLGDGLGEKALRGSEQLNGFLLLVEHARQKLSSSSSFAKSSVNSTLFTDPFLE